MTAADLPKTKPFARPNTPVDAIWPRKPKQVSFHRRAKYITINPKSDQPTNKIAQVAKAIVIEAKK